jgi:type 1 fimbria pilin
MLFRTLNTQCKMGFALALLFCANKGYASVTCDINPSGGIPTISLSGLPPISVTEGLPVGSELFQGRLTTIGSNKSQGIADCYIDGSKGNETFTVQIRNRVDGGVLSGLDKYTFKTNIPGIGARFYLYGKYITSEDTLGGGKPGMNTAYFNINGTDVVHPWGDGSDGNHLREMTFWLVKTGPVTPGVLNGVSLPKIEYRLYSAGTPINKLPARYMIIGFNGAVNITSPTCTTPSSVSVDLGEYTVSQLTQSGSSPWKDASIRLTNCQKFTGYQPKGADSVFNQDKISGEYDVKYTTIAPYANNVLGITLNGNQGNIDIKNGIVGIKTGSGEATGVAVQVASGTNGNVPVNLGAEYKQTLPKDGSSTITIPLSVRLKKNGSAIKAGNVTSQITYTINYK